MIEENFIAALARQIRESTVQVSKSGTVVQLFRAPIPASIQAAITENLGKLAEKPSKHR